MTLPSASASLVPKTIDQASTLDSEDQPHSRSLGPVDSRTFWVLSSGLGYLSPWPSTVDSLLSIKAYTKWNCEDPGQQGRQRTGKEDSI